METIELGSHLRVPKSLLTKEHWNRIRLDLRVYNRSYTAKRNFGNVKKGDVPFVDLWEDDGDFVILPRGYDLSFLNGQFVIEDNRPEPWSYESTEGGWEFHGELREDQHEAWEALAITPGDKLLCLGCGRGKTVISIRYAALYGLKTLVIVDQDSLVKQWTEQIFTFLGGKASDVGYVKAAKTEIGNRFTIATIQTLIRRLETFDKSFYDQFGLIIFDECHIMSAPQASRVLAMFPGERLGLSATPNRLDEMDPIFRYNLGGVDPVYTNVERFQEARWYFKDVGTVATDRGCYKPVYGKTKIVWRGGKQVSEPVLAFLRPRWISRACASATFNQIIFRDLVRAYEAGRRILLLGDRVEHLHWLGEWLVDSGYDAGVAVGDVKAADRETAYSQRILLATYQLAGKGLDIPELDTLFILFPYDDIGRMRQHVGRIDRLRHGKKQPLVVVYCHDGIGSMERAANAMKRHLAIVDPSAKIRVARHGT